MENEVMEKEKKSTLDDEKLEGVTGGFRYMDDRKCEYFDARPWGQGKSGPTDVCAYCKFWDNTRCRNPHKS